MVREVVRSSVREVTIPVEGGVRLAGDLMYPAGSAARYPVLVSMSPYHKDDVIGSIEAPRRTLGGRRLRHTPGRHERARSSSDSPPPLTTSAVWRGGRCVGHRVGRSAGVVHGRRRHVGSFVRRHDDHCFRGPTASSP